MTVTDRIALDPFGSDLVAGERPAARPRPPSSPWSCPAASPPGRPTGYDALRELILDPCVSKDARLHWRLWPELDAHPSWSWMANWVGVVNMLSTYGADHARLRKLVAPSFTHRRTEAMRPRVAALTAELLDALEAEGADGRAVDLRSGLAHPPADADDQRTPGRPGGVAERRGRPHRRLHGHLRPEPAARGVRARADRHGAGGADRAPADPPRRRHHHGTDPGAGRGRRPALGRGVAARCCWWWAPGSRPP